MQTKHFVHDPEVLLAKSLQSLALLQPELALDVEHKAIYAPLPKHRQKVHVISGGGAGHEPSFTGFVGDGLLTAAVSGTIFASPSSQQVLHVIKKLIADGARSLLITVMRYTGDVLNFGVALEKARVQYPGVQFAMLVIGDDVAVTRGKAGKVGRRGIAGTILIHKITGALAAKGYDLENVLRIGQLAATKLVSIGVSLNQVHVPGRQIGDNKQADHDGVELGMGIHNETGCGKLYDEETHLAFVVEEMLRQMLDTADSERNFLTTRPSQVFLLVNNLGALSVLELGAVVHEVTDQLTKKWHIDVIRIYAGTYMTSLDGPGFSVSLLDVIETGIPESLLDLLDAPCNAQGWRMLIRNGHTKRNATLVEDGLTSTEPDSNSNLIFNRGETMRHLQNGLTALIAGESQVTEYDCIVGDGDCGTTLKRGAQAIQTELETQSPTTLVNMLDCIASAIEKSMDGTSGALYAIFANALLKHVRDTSSQVREVDGDFWAEALSYATQVLSKYTPAQIGDRTMMDALLPFLKDLKERKDISSAARAAQAGAERTKSMRPALGRTVYIGDETRWLGVVPDPGAWGLSLFLNGLACP